MIEQLREKTGLPVKENEVLAPYTTFKIGGPAKYFVEVRSKQELLKSVQAAVANNLPYFLLGGGSNILISDKGFDGFVIRIVEGEFTVNNGVVVAFAGVDWPKLMREVVKAGLAGLEPCGNIPGTVGGAVRGNAGAYGVASGDFIREVECLIVNGTDVSLKLFSKEECDFSYRHSLFKEHPEYVVVEATFVLKPATPPVEVHLEEIEKEYQSRCDKQPLSFPSAGCTFTNIVYTDELVKFKDWEKFGKIAAGKFIDELGLKGKRIGGAEISEAHANFIINVKNATADDVIQLISFVKSKVRDEFGVQLQEEIQYVGFGE